MHKKISVDEAIHSVKCCSGGKNGGAKSPHERIQEVADEFYKLARGESDGHYRGMLGGLLAASFIAGDDELLTSINQKMNQLKEDNQA